MIAPVISLGAARAKRAGRSAGVGTMSARVQGSRVEIQFDRPVESFFLTAAQARFWAMALLTLADAVDEDGAP